MHLEDALAANTAALIAHTNALNNLAKAIAGGGGAALAPATGDADNAGGAAVGSGKKSAGKGKPEAEKPKTEYPAVSAAITKLAKEKGRDKALEILGEFGVKNAKDLKSGDFDAVIAKAEEALNAEDELA